LIARTLHRPWFINEVEALVGEVRRSANNLETQNIIVGLPHPLFSTDCQIKSWQMEEKNFISQVSKLQKKQ